MSRQHKIWVDVTGGSGKSFGCGNDDIILKICVGCSASNSELFSVIKIEQSETDGKIYFHLNIDGQDYRHEVFDRKTQEFNGITGRKINGSKRSKALREQEATNGFMKTVANIAAIGEFFTDNKQEANDWKKRMLLAGLDTRGLTMPEDWDDLSEDEKERRLNGAIEQLK